MYQSDGHSPVVSGREVAERRPGKAKTGEKAELALANEHFEAVFNAAWSSAGTSRSETKVRCVLPDVRLAVRHSSTAGKRSSPPASP
ncbi:hypothetical protein DKY63_17835 [Pseudomonas putida]|uniref:Uncharacterized protein n=1 Tax=Pseudomonas putida TaxID=303 RepID=A0A2Z4RL30_PSEPU|nr:hypothetical protein DKY63_17835 [Pseudomonas putida]